MLGNLLGGFIVILVGVNLMQPITAQVGYMTKAPKTYYLENSTTSVTILGLVPVFFALGIMSAGVSLAVAGLRNAGMV